MSEKLIREILANQTEIMRGLATLMISRSFAEPDAETARGLAFNAGRIEGAMRHTLETLNGANR